LENFRIELILFSILCVEDYEKNLLIHKLSKEEFIMQKYICTVCDYIYDPEIGDPDSGIVAGTAFEDLPQDWECPDCGVKKEDFEPLEN
jgi:rubredoxin